MAGLNDGKEDEVEKNEVEKSEAKAQQTDEELSALLDSCLPDFDNLNATQTQTQTAEAEHKAFVQECNNLWSKEFVDQSNKISFQEAFEEFLNAAPFPPVPPEVLAERAAKIAKSDADPNSTYDPRLKQVIDEFLLSLNNDENDPIPSLGPPVVTDEDLRNVFRSFGLEPTPGETPNVAIILQDMMQMLLAKDLLYPALRDVTERYPAWLEANKGTLDPAEYEKYNAQYEVMKSVCAVYATESPDDPIMDQKKRFEKIVEGMQKMQEYGNPPDSLVGEQGAGIQFDENGIPRIPGLPDLNRSNCSLM